MSTPPFPRARTCMHAEFDATPVNALTHTVTHMHTGNAPSAGRKTPHTGRLKEKLSDCHICRTPSLAGVKPNERSIALKLAANSACVQVRRCTFAPPPQHTHTQYPMSYAWVIWHRPQVAHTLRGLRARQTEEGIVDRHDADG
jgi:hypothetical protein